MSIELILLAVNINLVSFSIYLNDLTGQVFTLFILTVAAAEAAIGLAIIVVYYRNAGTIRIEEIDKFSDIDSLAALISICDEIISINNITAHLAGALDMKAKILLSTNSSWDYGVKETKSDWYNSLTLYRQRVPGEWKEVLQKINNDIEV